MRISILLWLVLMYTGAHCIYSDYWHIQKNISLKKDKYFSATLTQKQAKKDLHIKWTLYVNKHLTMQINLDGVNHQFNLKLSEDEFSFKLPLFYKSHTEMESPYLIIRFLEYDSKKSTASFVLFVRNSSQNITMTQGKK